MTTDPTPSPDVRELADIAADAIANCKSTHRRFLSNIDRLIIADAVLAAVSPVIRRQVREEIAEEIGPSADEYRRHDPPYLAGLENAAAIARTHAHPQEGK